MAGIKESRVKNWIMQHILYKILFTDPIMPPPPDHSSLASYARQNNRVGWLSKADFRVPKSFSRFYGCYSDVTVPFASSGTPFGASSTATSPSSSSSSRSSGCLGYAISIACNSAKEIQDSPQEINHFFHFIVSFSHLSKLPVFFFFLRRFRVISRFSMMLAHAVILNNYLLR